MQMSNPNDKCTIEGLRNRKMAVRLFTVPEAR